MPQGKPAEYFARLAPRKQHESPMTRPFSQYVDLFLTDKQAENRAPRYIGELKRTLTRFTAFLTEVVGHPALLSDFTLEAGRAYTMFEQDRERWADHPAPNLQALARPVGAQTVHNAVRMLKVFAGWCEREEWSLDEHGKPVNVLTRLTVPKVERKEVKPLTPEEEAQLAKACDDRTRDGCRRLAVLLLFLDTGARREELAGLQIQDIDFITGRIHLRWQNAKGRKERTVGFGRKTERALRRYGTIFRDPPVTEARPTDSFFLNPEGEPMTGVGVYRMFKRMAKRTGIDRLHPHLLRHTTATRDLEQGKSTREVQVRLGHSSIVTTEKYTHIVQRESDSRKRDGHVDTLPIVVRRPRKNS